MIQDFNMEKVFCFGDGFATGHIWPEWPQILQVLTPEHKVFNTAGIGAGTEFLVSGFVDQLNNMHNSTIIFQWPIPGRFDKLIEDNSWQDIIDKDLTYNFNVKHDAQGRTWWLSSRSQTTEIKNYHSQYVQLKQHIHRQNVYRALVSETINNINCQIVHTSTYEQDLFSRDKRFSTIRQKEVQPSPMVHFYWLVEQIIPQTNIMIDIKIQSQLETLINQTHWIPYDPDREEIWLKIKEKIKRSLP